MLFLMLLFFHFVGPGPHSCAFPFELLPSLQTGTYPPFTVNVLFEVVTSVRPEVLMGLSGAGRIWSPTTIKVRREGQDNRAYHT